MHLQIGNHNTSLKDSDNLQRSKDVYFMILIMNSENWKKNIPRNLEIQDFTGNWVSPQLREKGYVRYF